MTAFLENLLNEFATTFTDPSKRIFWGYLLTAGAIGSLVLLTAGARAKALRSLLSSRIWWSESARADYKVMAINKALFLLLAPWLLTHSAIATWLFEHLHRLPGGRPMVTDAEGFNWIPLLFTLALFLIDDFARFWVHRLMHRVPWLWAFHQVHHSARTLSPLTVLRTHPVEGLLFSLRSSLVNGVCVGGFVFFFSHQVDLITVLGGNAVVFAFNAAGSNLRHTHIHFRYWPALERWLISPAQHQVHHSAEPRHYDRNFGAALAIWDRLFGSLYLSEARAPRRFGVSRARQPNEQTLKALYWRPFLQAGRCFRPRLPAMTSFRLFFRKP